MGGYPRNPPLRCPCLEGVGKTGDGSKNEIFLVQNFSYFHNYLKISFLFFKLFYFQNGFQKNFLENFSYFLKLAPIFLQIYEKKNYIFAKNKIILW